MGAKCVSLKRSRCCSAERAPATRRRPTRRAREKSSAASLDVAWRRDCAFRRRPDVAARGAPYGQSLSPPTELIPGQKHSAHRPGLLLNARRTGSRHADPSSSKPRWRQNGAYARTSARGRPQCRKRGLYRQNPKPPNECIAGRSSGHQHQCRRTRGRGGRLIARRLPTPRMSGGVALGCARRGRCRATARSHHPARRARARRGVPTDCARAVDVALRPALSAMPELAAAWRLVAHDAVDVAPRPALTTLPDGLELAAACRPIAHARSMSRHGPPFLSTPLDSTRPPRPLIAQDRSGPTPQPVTYALLAESEPAQRAHPRPERRQNGWFEQDGRKARPANALLAE